MIRLSFISASQTAQGVLVGVLLALVVGLVVLIVLVLIVVGMVVMAVVVGGVSNGTRAKICKNTGRAPRRVICATRALLGL